MRKPLYQLALLTLLWASCTKPFDEVSSELNIDTDIAVPLVNTEIKINDFMNGLGSSNLTVRPDGLYEMQMAGDFAPSETFDPFAKLSFPISFPISQQTMTLPFPMPAPMRLDYADFKSGFFRWVINPTGTPLTVRLQIPQLMKGGRTFDETFLLSSNNFYMSNIDLRDWKLMTTAGQITFRCTGTDALGAVVNLTGLYEFTKLEAKMVKGYFGQQNLSAEKYSLNLDFFKNWQPEGEIQFMEPKIKMAMENSFGVPVSAKMRMAEVWRQNGSKLELISPLSNGVMLNYPSLAELNEAKITELDLQTTNSNVATVLNEFPKAIDFAMDAQLYPDITDTRVGFMTDASMVRTKMSVVLPFICKVKNFLSWDTLKVDFSKFKDLEEAEIKIKSQNGMPVDLALQGYFVNQKGAILDSLYAQNELILRGAPVAADGSPTGVKDEINFVKLAKEKFDRVRGAQKLILKYQIATSQNGNATARIKAHQKFALQMGVRAGLKL
jgi:hypothetical protein